MAASKDVVMVTGYIVCISCDETYQAFPFPVCVGERVWEWDGE